MNETNPTINWYSKNAKEFADRTFNLQVFNVRNRFLNVLPKGGFVLDAGCGSGRDIIAFLKRGFQVYAFDASPEMCEIASKNSGIKVECNTFKDFKLRRYDGIWACSSLLHVPRAEMEEVFLRFAQALNPYCHMYCSFIHGFDDTVKEDGRLFTNYTQDTFYSLIEKIKIFTVKEWWLSEDVRPEKKDTRWINAIIQKRNT